MGGYEQDLSVRFELRHEKTYLMLCLHLCTEKILHVFFWCLLIFFKINFFDFFSVIPFRVSNSLDPDQALCFVRPDLDPNSLQKLPADDTSS